MMAGYIGGNNKKELEKMKIDKNKAIEKIKKCLNAWNGVDWYSPDTSIIYNNQNDREVVIEYDCGGHVDYIEPEEIEKELEDTYRDVLNIDGVQEMIYSMAKDCAEYINDVVSSAEEAQRFGRLAILALSNNKVNIAIDLITKANKLERIFGDNSTWSQAIFWE